MRVRFAGCGDAFGSGGRWQTCIHLAADGQAMLVDCGTTSLVALKAQGLDPNAVRAVAVTHLHGDHFGGLPFLILDGQFSRRTEPLLVAGPPGIRDRLAERWRRCSRVWPGAPPLHDAGNRAGNRRDTRRTGPGARARMGGRACLWRARPGPAGGIRRRELRLLRRHPVDPGFRRAGHSGADLFAVEAYTFDRPIRYHLDYQTLGVHLEEIQAHRVVVTDMSARHAQQARRRRTTGGRSRHGHRPLTDPSGPAWRRQRPQLILTERSVVAAERYEPSVVAPEPGRDKMQNSLPSGSASAYRAMAVGPPVVGQ